MSTQINTNLAQQTQQISHESFVASSGVVATSIPATAVAQDRSDRVERNMTAVVGSSQRKVTIGSEKEQVVKGMITSAKIQSAKEQITSAIEACNRITQQPGISPEAKAVYQRLGDILKEAFPQTNGDFSADHIATALSSALKTRTNLSTAGGTGTVGMYHPDADGTEGGANQTRTTHGVPAPNAWEKNESTGEWDVPVDLGQKQCLTSLGKAGISAVSVGKVGQESMSVDDVLKNAPHPQNLGGCDFSKIPEDELSAHRYTFQEKIATDKTDKTPPKTTTYTWEAGFDPKKYSGQLAYESNQFSSDVRIHKLEPGTVLVRVFGKGQSVKAACWARLEDVESSFTCAQDLYKKLAVKAEWNGDGNLGVFIVPEGVDIWVAEGTIASQAEKYTAKVGEGEKGKEQKSTFLYEGGGTQVNILTPNSTPEMEEKEEPVFFAGVAPEIFAQCMFCFRDDGIVKEEQFTERQTITQGE